MNSTLEMTTTSLQRRYRVVLLGSGLMLMVMILAYAWFSVTTPREAKKAAIKTQGEEIQMSLNDTIDVVREHVFTLRRSVEHGLARPVMTDAASDIGSLHLDPTAKIEPKVLQRDTSAAATILSVAAAAHQWNKVFQWSYYYDGRERWMLMYPQLSRDQLFAATHSKDMSGSLKVVFEADGTRPVQMVGPQKNPQREMLWTPPYKDAGGKGMMVTSLAPVYLGDEFVGAVGADVTLDMLDRVLQRFTLEMGRALVVDKKGFVLADSGHALKGAKGPVNLADVIPSATVTDSDGRSDGGALTWRYPLRGTSWTLLIHLHENTLNAALQEMMRPYWMMAAALVLAILALAWVQNQRYAGPALRLAQYVEQLETQPSASVPRVPASWQPIFVQAAQRAQERHALLAKTQSYAGDLEAQVAERTQSLTATNAELNAAVTTLQRTQKDLVRADKLGTLGAMVAGVAHELRTPLGKAGDAATTLRERVREFQAQQQLGLRRTDLGRFVDEVGSTSELVEGKVAEASNLLQRFKQLAIDQASERARCFNLREVVDNVLAVMGPQIKQQPCTILNEVPDDLVLTTYAGTLGQMLSNLMEHALALVAERAPAGQVRLTARWDTGDQGEMITLSVWCNGTASGQNLPIADSLVNDFLGGTITSTATDEGTQFSVQVPRMIS